MDSKDVNLAIEQTASSLPSLIEIERAKLADLSGKALDLSNVSPFRYRFIDCGSYVDDGEFRLLEYDGTLENLLYSTISYVWKGLKVYDGTLESFHVAGALHADPIGFEVLRQACLLSLKQGLPLLWLDRVSIIQTHRADKDWQIRRMHDIYKQCQCCIILTGGLHKLSVLEEHEEGDWINRSWTLQEAVVPKRALCLFASLYGEGFLYASESSTINKSDQSRFHHHSQLATDLGESRIVVYQGMGPNKVASLDPKHMFPEGVPSWAEAMLEPYRTVRVDVRELEQNTSVYLGLSETLRIHDPTSYPLVFTARMYRHPQLPEGKWAERVLDTRSFAWVRSSSGYCLFTILMGGLRMDDLEEPVFPSTEVRVTGRREEWKGPELYAELRERSDLDPTLPENEHMQNAVRDAIWKSIAARRTSRPVDAILSAMGLFGITLDPQMFRGLKYPRLASTIMLAQEYLRRGGRTFWLTLSLPPIMDDGRYQGRTDRRMCTMPLMVENEGEQDTNLDYNSPSDLSDLRWTLYDAPKGSMDNQGYLKISVPSFFLPLRQPLAIRGVASRCYSRDTWIAYIGESSYANSSEKAYWDTAHHRLALHQHAPNRYHIVDAIRTPDFAAEAEGYVVREFSIGGPFPVSDIFERRGTNPRGKNH